MLLVIWTGGSVIAAVVRERGPQPLPPAEGRLITTPDGAIFAQFRGPEQGQPVVLIHGTAAWSGFWSEIASRLAQNGYRAIAVDLPPFGFSDRSAQGAYSRRDQAHRLAAFQRNLNLQNAIIVGHSFGAGATVGDSDARRMRPPMRRLISSSTPMRAPARPKPMRSGCRRCFWPAVKLPAPTPPTTPRSRCPPPLYLG